MTQHYRVDGRLVAVRSTGQGEPILFVHGFPLNHNMWHSQVSHLADTYRLIVPDLPGFGTSDAIPPDAMTMDRFADTLAAVLDMMHVEGPVTLCGLSMGGYIAFEFAKRHPERLTRLILVNTFAGPDTEEKAKGRLETAERVLKEGTSFLAQSMIPKLLSDRTQADCPDVEDAIWEMISSTPPETIAAALRGMAQRADHRPNLASLNVPALVISGQEDALVPPAVMKEMADSMPDARLIEVPDAGHLTPMERSILFNGALRVFMHETMQLK